MNVSPAHVMNESFLPSFLSLCIESRLLFLSFVFLASPFPLLFSFLSVFLAGLCRLTPLGGCRRCKGRLSNQTRLALALHAGAEMSEIQRVAAAVEEKIRRYESAFSAGAWGGRPQRAPPSSSSSSSSVSSTAVAWLGGIARLFSTRSGRS